MLSFWRTRKDLAVHFVFWPIIAVFVIWGFERYGNPVGGAAATVNDHTISINQYRNAVQRMIDFYNQIFQGNFDEKAQQQYRIKETALRELIDTELVSEQADKMGLAVTDAEVRDVITKIPSLQKDGKFSRDNYDSLLKYYRMSPAQFEDEERRNLVLTKTMHIFEAGLKPSQLEIEKEKSLRAVKKNVEILRVDQEALAAKMDVKGADAEKYEAAHQKEVKAYFDGHKDEFSKGEEIHARHILIKAKKGDAAEEKAAKEKIAKIQDELKTTAFEDLAKKYSDDPGSKVKGGDLDWFTRGRMVPEFEEAAFAMAVGQVSKPIQSQFGFHLIKVEGKHPAQVQSFEDAKMGIAKKLYAREHIIEVLKDAEKKLADNPQEGLKEIQGLDKNLKWQETGFFTAADDTNPKLAEAEGLPAAAESLSERQPVSTELIHNGNIVYVLRLKKAELAGPVDEKKLRTDLKKDYARDIYSSWSNTLRAGAKINVNPQLGSGEETSSAADE